MIGSIPSGLILAKFFAPRVNLFDSGSGSTGATNVFRVVGKLPAFLTLLFDSFKGYSVCLYSENNFELAIYGFIVVIGHIYPFWTNFKGGKGVAVIVGILFALNYYLCLFFCFIWICFFVVKRYSSLSSIIAIFASNVYVFFIYELHISIMITIISFFIILSHRANIIRLLNGRESKIVKNRVS